jgi:hypothetical protein
MLDPQRVWVRGFIGTAVDFAGQGWLSIGESMTVNAIAEQFTFSAWVKRTGNGTLLARRSVGANGFLYRFFIQDGRLGLQINSSNGAHVDFLGATAVPTGRFVHVAASYDAVTARVFLDGNDVGFQSYGPNIGPENSPLIVGGRQDASLLNADDRFDGVVDELSVYNRALSNADIRALADGFVPPSP